MRVLLTNNTLIWHAGSELYIRDLAIHLVRRGHEPVAYSRYLGPVADELRAASVPVVDDLCRITLPPDVIHAQHHVETMTALLRWPYVPAVHVCHGWEPWEEIPVWHPRIRRYVAVSRLIADRLVSSGIPAGRVEVLGNAVDLTRFRNRRRLPTVPTRALVFSNRATEDRYLPMVRAACAGAGITVDVIGSASGTATAQPENHLADYDLVFASGRGALEAMASGCAVVLADHNGLGGMITTKDVDRMRAYNFGLRVLQTPLTPEGLTGEIERYDPADALAVSERIREVADLEKLVDRLEELYRDAIEQQSADPPGAEEEARAEVTYLQWMKQMITDRENVAQQRINLAEDRDRLRSALGAATAALDEATSARNALASRHDELTLRSDALTAEYGELEARYRELAAERDVLQRELAAMEASDAWRLGQRFLSLPPIIRVPLRAAWRLARRTSRRP